MLFLLISIILTALIFAVFKVFGIKKVNTFHAIVVNYFVCVITGTLFTGISNVLNQPYDAPWIYIALVLGGVFITIFYLMALTAQKFSMSAASISSKMAFVMPVLFSLFILKVDSEFVWYNYIGIGLALIATYMSTASSSSVSTTEGKFLWLLPVLVFLGNGVIDITINYTNLIYITESSVKVFPIYIFLSASVIGGLVLLVKGERITRLSIISGLVLGVINYFTVFTFLKALSELNNNGAFVFPIYNTGIVVLSALIGLIVFREKLSSLNKIGIFVAVISIALVMY